MKTFSTVLLFLALLSVSEAFAQDHIELKVDGLKRGVYSSYKDFINDNPRIQDSINIESKPREHKNWVGTSDYNLSYAESGLVIKDFWGFSDGEHTYIRYGGFDFQIELVDDQLTFKGFARLGQLEEMIVGQALGILTDLVLVNFGKDHPTTYFIESGTGLITSERTGALEPIMGELALYRESKKEDATPISISVDEKYYYKVPPGVIHKPKYRITTNLVRVCVTDSLKNCISVQLIPDNIAYVKVSRKRPDESVELQLMEPNLGKSDVKKLERAAE